MAEVEAQVAEGRVKLADPAEATYWGRVRKTFHQLDVRAAFTTDHALQHALRVVAASRTSSPAHWHEEDVIAPLALTSACFSIDRRGWRGCGRGRAGARRQDQARHRPPRHRCVCILKCCCHWYGTKHYGCVWTDKPVLLPLRVSMIVPMNVIMDGAMLLANSTRSTVFAQWLNQTYNALHYYANRNASNEDTTAQRAVAYVAATGSAVAASLGIRKWARGRGSPALARLGPFGAVAAADLLNLAVMRQSEYLKGVHVFNEDGEFVGKSRRCGALAVASCVAGRVFAAAPILILPPLVVARLERRPVLAGRPWLRVPLLLALVGTAIQFSVPLTFGLFRQTAQLDAALLEPELAAATRRDGRPVRLVTYNKGI